jgi:hypothetical protein
VAARLTQEQKSLAFKLRKDGLFLDDIARQICCSHAPKPCKLVRGPLQREVTRRLEQFWSPQTVARRLPLDYPDDPTCA